jgi:hypothetical protein
MLACRSCSASAICLSILWRSRSWKQSITTMQVPNSRNDQSISEDEHWFDNKCEPITTFPQWGGGIISNQGNVCHNYTFPA